MKVEMLKGNDNPFFKKDKLKSLQANGAKAASKNVLFKLLDDAYDEAINSLVLRQMFFILIFEIGDISNRAHSIFKGKTKDGGGHAAREQFMWAMSWMRVNTSKQYYKFLMKDLFRQFVGLLSILLVRVKTKKNSTVIIDVINTLAEHDEDKLVDYYAKILKKSNPVEKILIFKSLTRVRLSMRQKVNRLKEKIGTRPLTEDVLSNMRTKERFYKKLSIKMNWEFLQYPNNIKFVGMNATKKEYTGELESVLFSSGKIVEFDKDEFFNWLNILSAGARRRTRVRLLNKDNTLKGKWKSNRTDEDLGTWFLEWEQFKETKQAEERVLVEKKRQGTITEDETVKLAKVKQEAKVTTGGITLKEELESLILGKADDTIIHSILEKTKFDVNATFILDKSGSMGGHWKGMNIQGIKVLWV